MFNTLKNCTLAKPGKWWTHFYSDNCNSHMHWFPVLERTDQHVACKGAGMDMYVAVEQAMIGKTPGRTLENIVNTEHCMWNPSTLNSLLPLYSWPLLWPQFLQGAFHNCIKLFQNWTFCMYLARHSSQVQIASSIQLSHHWQLHVNQYFADWCHATSRYHGHP